MVIPKPLCNCRVCQEARKRGIPYTRSGPSAFLHDINLLIDTPSESASQLNHSDIHSMDYLIFTHLDPDHVEGFRVVEQVSLDYRSWRAYPEKQICLLLPDQLSQPLQEIRSSLGSHIDFYQERGFLQIEFFQNELQVKDVKITAIPMERARQVTFVYVFEKYGCRVVYAPCDVKPFPEHRDEVQKADLLIIQPGIFEDGLKHGFTYSPAHISRTTHYTFEQTLDLAKRIQAKKVLFVHLEEYWNRSYDDYCSLDSDNEMICFAYDGMQLTV